MRDFESDGAKKPTNLSVNARLLKAAREQKINLAATLEEALIAKLRHQAESDWLAENEQALAEYTQHIEARGVFSDGLRRF